MVERPQRLDPYRVVAGNRLYGRVVVGVEVGLVVRTAAIIGVTAIVVGVVVGTVVVVVFGAWCVRVLWRVVFPRGTGSND